MTVRPPNQTRTGYAEQLFASVICYLYLFVCSFVPWCPRYKRKEDPLRRQEGGIEAEETKHKIQLFGFVLKQSARLNKSSRGGEWCSLIRWVWTRTTLCQPLPQACFRATPDRTSTNRHVGPCHQHGSLITGDRRTTWRRPVCSVCSHSQECWPSIRLKRL